jgi:hypothetical protein
VVNASLNWASIVGIVLAVGGALLYFMRSFKPALARDYDVFFAAVGLLCGGILFFQGWRLDPILQFGQFLLASTTVFFAYESVRLRGVTTDQARRSSYFDEDEPVPSPAGPFRPRMAGRSWDEPEADRFDEPQPLRRRIPAPISEDEQEDFYRPRRSNRTAIPERAASRRAAPEDWNPTEAEPPVSPSLRRYSTSTSVPRTGDFGARRRSAQDQPEPRRGSRPVATSDAMPRSSRRAATSPNAVDQAEARPGIPQGSPIRSSSRSGPSNGVSDADFSPVKPPAPREGGRDNSSRFDD